MTCTKAITTTIEREVVNQKGVNGERTSAGLVDVNKYRAQLVTKCSSTRFDMK